jgi:hypothetical protein
MTGLHRCLLSFAATILVGAGGCDEGPGDAAIKVPSGREVTLQDVITNAPGAEGAAARFRFIAPGLTPNDSAAASADMQALCDSYALPKVDGMVPVPQQIIISLAATAVPFGEAAPEVTQFFEAYAISDGACIWQVF